MAPTFAQETLVIFAPIAVPAARRQTVGSAVQMPRPLAVEAGVVVLGKCARMASVPLRCKLCSCCLTEYKWNSEYFTESL